MKEKIHVRLLQAQREPKEQMLRCQDLVFIAGIELLYVILENGSISWIVFIPWRKHQLLPLWPNQWALLFIDLLVLLGMDVHSLVGHSLTKLKFTLVFVPLWDRERSEVAHNLFLCLSKEQLLLFQGELELGIHLSKENTKLRRTPILLDQPPPVVLLRNVLSRNVSTLNLVWVELATPTP